MSGEIRIIANENLGLARLVAALTELPEELPDFVVIGGGAVGIRCNGLDRETQDLDSLAIEADRMIEVLVSSGAQQQRAYQVLTQSGVPLDVMAIHGTGGFKSTPQVNQAFELARLWAFETAPAEALVLLHRNEQGEWSEQTTRLRVATVPALLALTTVSMADRVNSAHPEKLYSDISDVCALVATSGVLDAVNFKRFEIGSKRADHRAVVKKRRGAKTQHRVRSRNWTISLNISRNIDLLARH